MSCVSLRPQGRSRREGHLIRISPDNLLNILQLCAPYRVVHKPACDK
nr:MAG TPA: hypothetical protein [Caudoviricetes sp.]